MCVWLIRDTICLCVARTHRQALSARARRRAPVSVSLAFAAAKSRGDQLLRRGGHARLRSRESMSHMDLYSLDRLYAEFTLWRAGLREWYLDAKDKCTPLKFVGTLILFGGIGGWAYGMRAIHQAAHTPEFATVATPRTMWSSKMAGQIARWHDFQQRLAREAHAYEPASPYDNRVRLVLLGDSITEAWRGTKIGEERPDATDTPEVLSDTLAKRWPKPLVLGISGDQTQHVLWRLRHGELSRKMAADERLLVVLLIGTNNLAAGHTPEEVADGVTAIVQTLLRLVKGRVLVNALFPRGDGNRRLPSLCPPTCGKGGRPLRSFRPIIDRVNGLVNRSVAALAKDAPHRVRFTNCGKLFEPEQNVGGANGSGRSAGIRGGMGGTGASGWGGGRAVAAAAEEEEGMVALTRPPLASRVSQVPSRPQSREPHSLSTASCTTRRRSSRPANARQRNTSADGPVQTMCASS